ncbi:hypothetical protein H4S01_003853 [Coemansia sp. RSA 2610]|nr:hypothetical protein H4S01_003853 [Coemansia sp. RSA 2610]
MQTAYRRLSSEFRPLYDDMDEASAYNSGGSTSSADFTEWERIGRGGFGKVYRARAKRGARQYGHEVVAIKVVEKRALRDRAAEQRLAAEVAVQGGLAHRHIVRLLDSFEDEARVYLVLEYCEHGDLWRELRRRGGRGGRDGELAALSEGEARWVMRQLGAALAYMHGRAVLHRDLKLANVMLGRNMDVKLGDFGLATNVESAEPATMCGTPSYISPEIMARGPYGLAADAWALGCLFVTLLTGRQPFRDAHGQVDAQSVRGVRLPRDLSAEARQLVRALLQVDPRRRLRCDQLLAHPFFNSMLAQTPLQAYAEPPARVLGPASQPLQPQQTQMADPACLPVAAAPSADLVATTTAAAQSSTAPRPARCTAPTLQGFTAQRLRAPLKRTLKNGHVYVRADHVVVLDVASSPTLVSLDAAQALVCEFARPLRSLDSLTPARASRRHAWDLALLPARVAKSARLAIRCVAYLLSQQPRIQIATPQGRACLFDDLTTLKLDFFNGIKVRVCRARLEATVEIPTNDEDLPNEIQKVPMDPADFAAEAHERSGGGAAAVPGKIRRIIEHVRLAVRKAWAFDAVLREFEPHGRLHAEYAGQIAYPVRIDWDTPELDYVPPGLARGRRGPGDKENRRVLAAARDDDMENRRVLAAARGDGMGGRRILAAARAGNTAGSSTIVGPQKPQWGAHVLDRRTVDDTPTRRLNLGPITRLVEEFNQHVPGPAPARPGASQLLQLHTPHKNPDIAQTVMQQAFANACCLPHVGWCLAAEAPGGEYLLTLLFADGARLLVDVGAQTATFKHHAHACGPLPIDHAAPQPVKDRLSYLPQFLAQMGLSV